MPGISQNARGLPRLVLPALLAAAALGACSDQQPVASREPRGILARAIQEFSCTGSVGGTVSCGPAAGRAGPGSADIFGGGWVKLTSSNVSYDSISEIYQFDVTVKNQMKEALGTPDGTVADPDGVRVFFSSGPAVTGGTGTISVANADGTDTFTASNQPYFAYHEILAGNTFSSAHTWQLAVSRTVTTFAFTVAVEADFQYLLVINEVLTNPGGTITDANGEWIEIYNAGIHPVDLQGLVLADSSAAGRRPYHTIASSLTVSGGSYVTLGNSTNTTLNGGATVDYAYGTALALANGTDAVKISRPYGTDTLTLDRTAYTSATISAQDGVSRELKNPRFDNSNMDGSNWADAVTVYGPGGKGSPKAQNSTFVP